MEKYPFFYLQPCLMLLEKNGLNNLAKKDKSHNFAM